MNTRVVAVLFSGFWLVASAAAAQEGASQSDENSNGGIVAPDLPLPPARPTCFKLQSAGTQCVLVDNAIVDYERFVPFVVDLNGAWKGPSGELVYIYFYADAQYAAGYTIFIDMSLQNRPDAFGFMNDYQTMTAVFPDDRDYTGALVSPTQIRWSNNTVWTKQ